MKTVSPDIQIAFVILEHNQKKEPIWTGKLHDIFKDKMSKNQISVSLDVLADWGILKGAYGSTIDGRAGYCYYINPDHIATLEKIRKEGERR